jgi:hypothetical protein
LDSTGGGVDSGGDEPGRDKLANAEDGCGEAEDGDAGDAGGEGRDVKVGFVCCETAEGGEDAKGNYFTPCG